MSFTGNASIDTAKMMCKEAYNYVWYLDMGLGGTCFKATEKNQFLGIAFSNIIVMILDNYSLIVKTTLILSL